VNEGEAGTVCRCAQATKFHIRPNSTPLYFLQRFQNFILQQLMRRIGIERFRHLCIGMITNLSNCTICIALLLRTADVVTFYCA